MILVLFRWICPCCFRLFSSFWCQGQNAWRFYSLWSLEMLLPSIPASSWPPDPSSPQPARTILEWVILKLSFLPQNDSPLFATQHPLPHQLAVPYIKPSTSRSSTIADRVKNEQASTRCAGWDLLCQADWVITIQVRNPIHSRSQNTGGKSQYW